MTQYEKAMLILASAQTAYLEAMAKAAVGLPVLDFDVVRGVRAEARAALVINAPEAVELLNPLHK